MPNILFNYQGRNSDGRAVSGELEANNIEDIVLYLKQQNIIPINIKPAEPKGLKLPRFLSSAIQLRQIEPFYIMNFCRQLAILNDAGLSLIKSINKLSSSSTSNALKIILSRVANDISAGLTLSEALAKHPNAFSSIIVSIIYVGENTGRLSEVLTHLGDYIEASITNKRRLISAVRYPIFVLASALTAILVMNFLVIPKFADMFTKFQLDLPLATRIILGTSQFLLKYKIVLLVAVFIILFGIRSLLKIPKFRYIWDQYKLKIPIFGDLQNRIILSQFTWTFSLILRSGVPILKGITLASGATENIYFGQQLLKMREAIEHGENLSHAAIATGLFTPMTIQMIEVGEETEKLDESLSEVAKYYDQEIDYDLKRMNEIIEPILLMMIGMIVLILALGIYFPLWDLIKVAKI